MEIKINDRSQNNEVWKFFQTWIDIKLDEKSFKILQEFSKLMGLSKLNEDKQDNG